MNHLSDWHQISDISGISTISQSSSIMNRMDFSQSLLDNYSNVLSSSKSITNQATNPIETAAKSLTLYEENMSEYIKADIVYHCVKEVSSNCKNILPESTADKLKALLLIHEFNKYGHLPSSLKHMQDKLTLLGIMDLPPSDLNPSEKLDVKCYVETTLREKIHNMILMYETIGMNVKELKANNEYSGRNRSLECNDASIVQWKNKIEELAQQYQVDLLKHAELIDKWNKLKYNGMSQAYLKKSEHLLLQAQVAELQAKITKLSCTIRMFKETPMTISAFRMLSDIVNEKLKAVTDEIYEKEELKKLYDSLKNTEYDQVLENYLQLCNVVKKKKHILDMLG